MRPRGRKEVVIARGALEVRRGKQDKNRRCRGGQTHRVTHGEQTKRSDNGKISKGLNDGRTSKCLPHIGRRTMKNNNPLRGRGISMWLRATGGREAVKAVPVGGLHHRPRVRLSNTAPGQHARTFGIDMDKKKGKRPLVTINGRPGVWTRSGEAAVDLTNSNNRSLGKKSLE